MVLQQPWTGVGARFHIQDLWLYVAPTVVVVLLIAGIIDRFEDLVQTGLLFVAAAFRLLEMWGLTLS